MLESRFRVLFATALIGAISPALGVGENPDLIYKNGFEGQADLIGLDLIIDSALDSRDVTPGDGICDDGTGKCTLRAAIDETNSWSGSPNTVSISPGVNPTLVLAGTNDDANATGDIDITSVVTIDASGAVINGNGLDRVLHIHAGGDLTLSGATITGGRLTGSNYPADAGGGIHNQGGTLALNESSVSGNTTGSWGGGIESSNAAKTTITRSTIDTNSAIDGGGGLDVDGAGSTLSIVLSTVSANTTNGSGGGVSVFAPTSIRNSTISGNTGGGITQSSGTVEVVGSIVSDQASGPDCTGTITSVNFNLESSTTCAFTSSYDLQNTDPLLKPLHDNGGPTRTQALGDGSPALDAVVPDEYYGCGASLPKDQRGVSRPIDAGWPYQTSLFWCDMGAVEHRETEITGVDCTSPPSIGPGVDLTGCDLNGVDLTGADLTGATLTSAKMAGAILTGMRAVGIRGGPSTLPAGWVYTGFDGGAALVGPGASLSGADLRNGDLSNADLTGADLSGATLTNISSGNTIGTQVQLPLDWVLRAGYLVGPGANLTGAQLVGANLAGVNLSSANLTSAKLDNAVLVGATLTGVILRFASFQNPDIRFVTSGNITDAEGLWMSPNLKLANGYLIGPYMDLRNLDFSGHYLGDVDLTASNLTNTILNGTDLYQAHLTGAIFTGVSLTGVKSGNISSDPPIDLPAPWQLIDENEGYGNSKHLVGPTANLTDANFGGLDLSGLDLSGTNLTNANFLNVDLTGSTLTGATLQGTLLAGATIDLLSSGGVIGSAASLPGLTKIIVGYVVGPGVNLTSANLSNANLFLASLEDTILTSAILTNVSSGGVTGTPIGLDLSWQIVNGYLIGPGANLSSANLSGADLSEAELHGANLSSTDFSGTNLTLADLTEAILSGTILVATNLTVADLTGATGTPYLHLSAIYAATICPTGVNSVINGGNCQGQPWP